MKGTTKCCNYYFIIYILMQGMIFSSTPEMSMSVLAGVFKELLLQKDCYLRALRMLLKEIVSGLRRKINLSDGEAIKVSCISD